MDAGAPRLYTFHAGVEEVESVVKYGSVYGADLSRGRHVIHLLLAVHHTNESAFHTTMNFHFQQVRMDEVEGAKAR